MGSVGSSSSGPRTTTSRTARETREITVGGKKVTTIDTTGMTDLRGRDAQSADRANKDVVLDLFKDVAQYHSSYLSPGDLDGLKLNLRNNTISSASGDAVAKVLVRSERGKQYYTFADLQRDYSGSGYTPEEFARSDYGQWYSLPSKRKKKTRSS